MLTRTNFVRAIVAIAALVATWAILGTAIAQRAAVPKPQHKRALGEPEVTQLLLLMDTDKSGKISPAAGTIRDYRCRGRARCPPTGGRPECYRCTGPPRATREM
jgi:hypothetical protein